MTKFRQCLKSEISLNNLIKVTLEILKRYHVDHKLLESKKPVENNEAAILKSFFLIYDYSSQFNSSFTDFLSKKIQEMGLSCWTILNEIKKQIFFGSLSDPSNRSFMKPNKDILQKNKYNSCSSGLKSQVNSKSRLNLFFFYVKKNKNVKKIIYANSIPCGNTFNESVRYSIVYEIGVPKMEPFDSKSLEINSKYN
ncbi:hypothetical protein BpHYR1_034440 [Brachionus plicatilis]|uniref:Uncharacterized protein n=1 Tax=Brachionus plicatilis TaxID=10195 RepID=A0A3M7QYQ7_BRAPC|nr:hypothetical protein BpHYR1_034440 [Brachionus plicatilis]